MTRFETKYLLYAIAAAVILVFASIPLAEDRLIWTAVYPFIVLIGTGILFKQFRSVYVEAKPTPAMNAIQLLYLLDFAYAAFLSFIVILSLIR